MPIQRSFPALCLSMILFAVSFGQAPRPTEQNKYPQAGPLYIKGNLMVVNEKGDPVGGLTMSDVTIYEEGTQQTFDAFRSVGPSAHVGLAVDNSGSLRMQIDGMLRTARDFVSGLDPQDTTFAVSFISSDKIFLVQDRTKNRSLIHDALNNMYIEGGRSAIFDALFLTSEKLMEQEKNEPSARHALIVISDGENVTGKYGLNDLFETLKDSNIQIFPIFFTSRLNDKLNPATKERFGKSNAIRLGQVLALRTGGRATILDGPITSQIIADAVKLILSDIRSNYVFGYAPTNQKRDGTYRRLKIEIKDGPNGEKRKAIFNASQFIPKD